MMIRPGTLESQANSQLGANSATAGRGGPGRAEPHHVPGAAIGQLKEDGVLQLPIQPRRVRGAKPGQEGVEVVQGEDRRR